MLGRKAKKAPVEDFTGATFETTGLQDYLLEQLTHPECIDAAKQYFTLTEGLRISPPASPRRIERALKKTVKMHDILRGHFVQEDGKWVMKMMSPDDITLDVTEYGDVTREEMYDIVSRVPDETMEVDAPKLVEFRMLRFGKLGDVILFRVHHILTDAYGLLVMIEDLVRAIINFPGIGEGMTHAEYMENHYSKLPEFTGKIAEFWTGYLDPPPPAINFGRYAKGIELDRLIGKQQIHQSDTFIDKDEYEALSAKATEAGGSFFALVACALGNALKELYGVDDYIGRCLISRNDAQLGRYAGSDLQWCLFRTKQSEGDTLLDRTVVLRNHLVDSNTYRSMEFDQPFGRMNAMVVEKSGVLPQIFIHIGAASGRAKASMLSKLLESQGAEVFKVGPVEVERMNLPRRPIQPVPCDLSVLVVPTSGPTLIRLRGDIQGLEMAEMDAIGAKMVEHVRGILA